jgi:hypothetical protein
MAALQMTVSKIVDESTEKTKEIKPVCRLMTLAENEYNFMQIYNLKNSGPV